MRLRPRFSVRFSFTQKIHTHTSLIDIRFALHGEQILLVFDFAVHRRYGRNLAQGQAHRSASDLEWFSVFQYDDRAGGNARTRDGERDPYPSCPDAVNVLGTTAVFDDIDRPYGKAHDMCLLAESHRNSRRPVYGMYDRQIRCRRYRMPARRSLHCRDIRHGWRSRCTWRGRHSRTNHPGFHSRSDGLGMSKSEYAKCHNEKNCDGPCLIHDAIVSLHDACANEPISQYETGSRNAYPIPHAIRMPC